MPVATQSAQLYVLTLEVPAGPGIQHGLSTNAGVVLLDSSTGSIHLRLRRDWDLIAPGEAEVLNELQDDLERKAAEWGAGRLLDYLSSTLSNVLRISEPRDVIVPKTSGDDFDRALGRFYRQHVDAHPRPFVTHVPRYTLAVAAGKFLENEPVRQEDGDEADWVEVPVGLRLTPDMFAARIVGESMQPRIPDGSLCLFRAGVTGSRQGRLVLVEYLGGGTNDAYTVKRYFSEKSQLPDGTWSHQRIRLEPLNPAFDAWDLDPEQDRFRVIAEFVQVLDTD